MLQFPKCEMRIITSLPPTGVVKHSGPVVKSTIEKSVRKLVILLPGRFCIVCSK